MKDAQTPNETPNKRIGQDDGPFQRRLQRGNTNAYNKIITGALDLNDLLDVRSNQQFIDKLSNELNRGNHHLHGTAEKLTRNRHLNTERKFAE